MKGKRNLWIILAAVLVLVAIGGFFLWRSLSASSGTTAERTTVVERRTLLVTVSASGNIEPTTQVNLSFDLPGRAAEVAVDIGDPVAAGQPLARLDTELLERAVAQSELGLRQAELRLERLQEPADEADIRRAQDAVYQAAAALDVAQLGRSTVLSSTLLNESMEDVQDAFDDARQRYEDRLQEYRDGEIDYWYVDKAQQRYEDAQLALSRLQQQADLQSESAGNDLERAQQSYQEASDSLQRLLDGADALDLEAAQADVAAAGLALDSARSNLEHATLTAPFDGIVSAVNVTVGEMTAAGVPAISVVDPSAFHITINVDELDVVKLSAGLPAEITLDALPGVVITGAVERIGPAATADPGGAISYPVVIALDPSDSPVRAGMSATTVIAVEELADQLLIPNWVVRIDQTTGQTYVYRQRDGHLEQVNVRLGVRYEGQSQVLDGLQEGDVLALVRDSPLDFMGQQ